MHRFSRARIHSRSTTKTVQVSSSNGRREPPERRHSVGREVKKFTSVDNLNPRTYGKWSGLYRNGHHGALVSRMFVRYTSNFYLHPEKLKQVMRGKVANDLISYYDSEAYKKKATAAVEEQYRVLLDGTPSNINENDVTNEYMINCAQPRHKPKVIVVKKKRIEDEEEDDMIDNIRRNVIKRSGVPDLLRRMRSFETDSAEEEEEEERSVRSLGQHRGSATDFAKKYRKRTTILPLYLKKIQTMAEKKDDKIGLVEDPSVQDVVDEKFTDEDKIDYDPHQELKKPLILNIIKSQYRSESFKKKIEEQKKLKEKMMKDMQERDAKDNYRRIKNKPKYVEYREEYGHWYQRPDSLRKFAFIKPKPKKLDISEGDN